MRLLLILTIVIFLKVDLGDFDETKWIEDELPNTVDASKE